MRDRDHDHGHDPGDEDEWDDAACVEAARQAVLELLGEGPRGAAAVAEALHARGLLDPLVHETDPGEPVDLDELADAVADVFWGDRLWRRANGDFADTHLLVEGMVLAHRLTEAELEAEEVLVLPDLDLLDWDTGRALTFAADDERLHATLHVGATALPGTGSLHPGRVRPAGSTGPGAAGAPQRGSAGPAQLGEASRRCATRSSMRTSPSR